VTGADLRRRFGLYDSWAYYTSITSKPKTVTTPASTPAATPDAASGGTAPATPAGTARAGSTALSGTIAPAQRGAWLRIQRRVGTGWVTYAWTTTGANGSYSARLGGPGTYRVLFRGAAGPAVSVSA
jgi:stage II sporulation protein D